MKIYTDSTVLTLSGKEEVLEFNHAHNFFHVQNLGNGTIKVSASTDINGRTDGVIDIPSGGSASISNGKDGNLYLYGSGKINVITNDSGFNPFRNAGQGGGGGGTGGVTSYDELDNKPSINTETLKGDMSLQDVGINVITNDKMIDMINSARNAENILSEAIWRKTYPEGMVSDPEKTYVDTGIAMSHFMDKELTLVFKIQANDWHSLNSLMGYMVGDGAITGNYSGMFIHFDDTDPSDDPPMKKITAGGVYHHYMFDAQLLTDTIGQTITCVYSDSVDQTYMMVNGVLLPEYKTRVYKAKPNGNLMLLRYCPGRYAYPPSFNGIVYDMIVFDKFLSKEDAAFVSDCLLEEG